MKTEKIVKLNIGDELFRYVALKGIWTYTVKGIRDYSDSILYEIECEACNHGGKCRLLVSQNDNHKSFQYVSMLNDDEENEQYYWHTTDYFYISNKECRKQAYLKEVKYKENRIKELEAQLKQVKDSLIELNLLVEGRV